MRRPWNIIDHPVYSLATYQNDKVNMNICTYVNAVSMKPKMYSIAIDYNTLTYDYLKKSDLAVLQLLNSQHSENIKLLGKKSGRKIDKTASLVKKELITDWNGLKVLKGANAYLLLRKTQSVNIDGDHEIFFFTCEKYKTYSEDGILMFNQLIEQGIIL